LISPARQVAYELLCRIGLHGAFSDYALNSPILAPLHQADKNLATEIVYGTLRWQGYLDHFAATTASRPWEDVQPEAKIALRMAIYQMARMDRIPAHALVHDAVEIAKSRIGRGGAGFINAVLRKLSQNKPWDSPQGLADWDAVSLPKWLWERWSARFGREGAREYALSLNRPPQAAVRLRDSACPENATLSEIVPGAALLTGGRESALEDYQDEASQLVPHLLGDLSGSSIWDACAAPGGKTEILWGLAGDEGTVVSGDLNPGRARRMKQFLARQGRPGLVVVADAGTTHPFRCLFDAVLIDAPCSGLGTLRRNPEIKWRFQAGRFQELHAIQLRILTMASTALKAGGRMLYSTCSTEPEEGERVVGEFLEHNPGFFLLRPERPLGISNWLDEAGFLKTFPSTKGWDGFFAALIARHG
jgi:16S rRNA (cytosine967-C5)-methyltransferase